MKLPLFPLQTVFFPGETVPLHIFEDRYKELVNDCHKESLTFGIPVYIDEQIAFGTEVQLVEVVTTYESGAMDIVCVARQVFRVNSFEATMGDKLYPGGEVQFLDNINDGDLRSKAYVLDRIKELYDLMGVDFSEISPKKFNSYQLAHKMGLSYQQEYQLLQLAKESERLSYIRAHLDVTIQVLQEVNRTKDIIDMNGHFRNFDPLDFKDFEV